MKHGYKPAADGGLSTRAGRTTPEGQDADHAMLPNWNDLSDELQLTLTREALKRASETIAGQAECLAGEMETGGLLDRGGADALRLLAAVIRVNGRSCFPGAVGHA